MSAIRVPHDTGNPILDAAQAASVELKVLRDRLSSDTRHSFRTPLTVIDGTARRLERKLEKMSPDEVRSRVHTIREMVEKMVGLVEQSIQMSELASFVQDIPPRRSDVVETIDSLVREHRAGTAGYNLVGWTENCDDLGISDQRLVELLLDKLFALGGEIVQGKGRVDFVAWASEETLSLSLKAVFEASALVNVEELEERILENDRLTMLCKGMEVTIIRLLIEQNGGELEIEIENDFVEFEIQLPITAAENDVCKSLIIRKQATQA